MTNNGEMTISGKADNWNLWTMGNDRQWDGRQWGMTDNGE